MRRFSDRQSMHTLAELNVTPLLDLAFVLLIIFMITTPLMEKKTDVVLPSSAAAANATDPSAVQRITIHRDAEITLNDEVVDAQSLAGKLEAIHGNRPDSAVIIRSDKDLPVQKLIDVMDAVQRAGIAKVGVITQPSQP